MLGNSAGVTSATAHVTYAVTGPNDAIIMTFQAPSDTGCTTYLASFSALLSCDAEAAEVGLLASIHPTTTHATAQYSPVVGNATSGWLARAQQTFALPKGMASSTYR